MALLSRKMDYALLILSYLHQKVEGGCARIIADQFGLSRPFVANILKRLCQSGFVASQRGIKGGYSLARPVEEIFLTDLMDIMDGKFHLAQCCQESPMAGCQMFGICPIQGSIAKVHQRVRDILESVSVAELLNGSQITPQWPIELEVFS